MGFSMLKALTGLSESTQVSLDAPPRCMEITRALASPATLDKPPGMT